MDVFVDLSCNSTFDGLDLLGLLGRGFLVDLDVEGDEQDQVGGQDAAAGNSRTHRACTRTTHRQSALQVRQVLENDLIVGSKVHEAQIQDELDDLETSDPFLPPDTDTTSGQEVVKVHNDMDEQVERDDDPRDGRLAQKLGVAQQGGGTVMVGVQEGQFLLLDHQEQGVDELDVLGDVVEEVQELQLLGPRVVVADGVVQAVVVDDGEDLLDHEHKKNQRQRRQHDVVDLEQAVQHQRLDVELLEHVVAAEHEQVVGSDHGDHRRKRGERTLALDPGEICGHKRAAGDTCHGLVEEREQLNTKRSVWGGKREDHGKKSGEKKSRCSS